jgi:biotin transport system ATP-binding protein
MMIHLNDLSYGYSRGVDVLSGISLSVKPGQLLGLVGANGSGKSTVLAIMAGLLTPRQGSVLVSGREFLENGAGNEQRVRLVMQDADLQIVGATVEEDLLLGREAEADAGIRARDIADRFGLGDVWAAPVHSLSWGMKKKLCLAGAALDRPRVLLLDEPFSGLDYPSVREMRALIDANRQQGITQVLAAHDLEAFVDMADRLAVLEKGTLVLEGVPADVLGRVASFGVRPPCSWVLNRSVTHGGEW